MSTKRCIDCGEDLPVECFYRVHKGAPFRQSRCKVCDNAKRAGNVQRGPGRVDFVRRPDGSLERVRRVSKAKGLIEDALRRAGLPVQR